jgi:hypothetical protein
MAELQTKIRSPVARRAGLKVRHDCSEAVPLGPELGPVVSTALPFPEAYE